MGKKRVPPDKQKKPRPRRVLTDEEILEQEKLKKRRHRRF